MSRTGRTKASGKGPGQNKSKSSDSPSMKRRSVQIGKLLLAIAAVALLIAALVVPAGSASGSEITTSGSLNSSE